jgi:hypothetical protein
MNRLEQSQHTRGSEIKRQIGRQIEIGSNTAEIDWACSYDQRPDMPVLVRPLCFHNCVFEANSWCSSGLSGLAETLEITSKSLEACF